jgi:hypothetical protein
MTPSYEIIDSCDSLHNASSPVVPQWFVVSTISQQGMPPPTCLLKFLILGFDWSFTINKQSTPPLYSPTTQHIISDRKKKQACDPPHSSHQKWFLNSDNITAWQPLDWKLAADRNDTCYYDANSRNLYRVRGYTWRKGCISVLWENQ